MLVPGGGGTDRKGKCPGRGCDCGNGIGFGRQYGSRRGWGTGWIAVNQKTHKHTQKHNTVVSFMDIYRSSLGLDRKFNLTTGLGLGSLTLD